MNGIVDSHLHRSPNMFDLAFVHNAAIATSNETRIVKASIINQLSENCQTNQW